MFDRFSSVEDPVRCTHCGGHWLGDEYDGRCQDCGWAIPPEPISKEEAEEWQEVWEKHVQEAAHLPFFPRVHYAGRFGLRLLVEWKRLRGALGELTTPTGAYSTDNERYFKNIIEHSIAVAEGALDGTWEPKKKEEEEE